MSYSLLPHKLSLNSLKFIGTKESSCCRQTYLQDHIDQDGGEGIGEVEDQPDLHRLDIRRDGQAGGDREVDGGEDHHAGDVDGEDHVVLVVPSDVIGGLVDHVHENGWKISDHEHTVNLP